MGCDIHIITEIKENGKWTYVPEYPEVLGNRNYSVFGVLAGVRDSFGDKIFEAKGLPSDISGMKFRFCSEKERIHEAYINNRVICLVIDGKVIDTIYGSNDLLNKTRVFISEKEYEMLKNEDSEERQKRYRDFGWVSDGNERKFYVKDAKTVNGSWETVPYNKICATEEEFAQKYYSESWEEDVKDYGTWDIDFNLIEKGDYHSASYITLKEFHNADYSSYTAIKYKIDKRFLDKFYQAGGVLPDIFKLEESPIDDICDCIREAVNPTVMVSWQPDEISADLPLFKGIKSLEEIAEKYGVLENDIRIVFAFDN